MHASGVIGHCLATTTLLLTNYSLLEEYVCVCVCVCVMIGQSSYIHDDESSQGSQANKTAVQELNSHYF